MKARGLIFAAFIAATGSFLCAESPAWSNEGPPFVVSALAVSPADGVAYAGTQDGLYVSSDRGRSWVRVGPDLPPANTIVALAPDPVRPGVLYLALDRDGGVFKSENYGRSHIRLSVGFPTFCGDTRIAVAPSDPSTVYLSRCGLSRSRDGGASWTPLRLDRNVYSLAVHPRNPLRILAGTDWGRPIESDVSSLIWASDDGGESWRAVAVDPPLGNEVLDIAFDHRNPDLVHAACYGVREIGTSRDGGETWEGSREGYAGYGARAIEVDPTTSELLYVTAQNPPLPTLPPVFVDLSGIYRSANRGATWSRMPGSRSADILAIDPSGGLLYAARFGGTGVDVYGLFSERPPIVRPSPAARAPRTVVRPDGPVPKS